MANGSLDPNKLNSFGKHWNVEFLGPPLNASDISRAKSATKPERR
jgi:hypothetical protein